MNPPAPAPTYFVQHRDDGVAVVWIDDPEAGVNTLKRGLADEFRDLLERLDADARVRGVVLASGKPDGFIAGADLDMLAEVDGVEEGADLSRLAQDVARRVAGLRVPTAAAIHGPCLGGGLEIALAFDLRIASDDPLTRLGLPEVRLGLLPGGGGTQRLPRLVGVRAALDLLLTGREISAARALALGVVDAVVARAGLVEVAAGRVLALARLRPPGRRLAVDRPARSLLDPSGFVEWLLAGNPLGRRIVFGRARAAAALRRTRGHYPAPLRILEVVRTGLERGEPAGLAAEARAFGELLSTPEASELIGLFFAVSSLKKDGGAGDPGVEPRPVEAVGVIGAGLMGAGIAFVTAHRAGCRVVLEDRDEAALDRGLGGVRGLLDDRVARGRLAAAQRDASLGRIGASLDRERLRGCDVVIEAVYEDVELKQAVLRDVEALGDERAIFASNTSSIPIARIAARAARPANVIGMHYFSPVDRMPLLEVVVTDRTAPEVVATCVGLGRRQGKTVIVVRDGPGFYTSRILAPYLNEAAWLLAEGNPVEAIDDALLGFGFPVGPLALLDEVGVDVAAKVSVVLGEAFGPRMTPPPGLAALSADGCLGRRGGRGFYRYGRDGKTRRGVDGAVYHLLGVRPAVAGTPEAMAERCVLAMVNEAMRCLDDGVLRSARDGNVGAVFGLGFPPFLGGPFRYAETLGVVRVGERLNALRARFGDWCPPRPGDSPRRAAPAAGERETRRQAPVEEVSMLDETRERRVESVSGAGEATGTVLERAVRLAHRYLLALRFALFNVVAFGLLGALWLQGWLDGAASGQTAWLCGGIFAVFLFGLAVCARRVWRVSRELNDVRAGRPRPGGRGHAYLETVRGRPAESRAISAGLLRLRLASYSALVRHFADTLVFLGLVGTVVGFIIALSSIDPAKSVSVDTVAPTVATLIHGMSIALYTTLIGAVLHLWLGVNHRLLATGAMHLHDAIVERGERLAGK